VGFGDVVKKRKIRERLSNAQRAFRDAMRDILESEGWFEVDVAEPRSFRFTPPHSPTATA
jgi:hypothetical protein